MSPLCFWLQSNFSLLQDGQPNLCVSSAAAFELLAQSIETVSKDYCSHPPKDSTLPLNMFLEPNLPEIVGSTEPSMQLRSILIQHKIFKVLHRRIFQRFLFVPFEDHSDVELDRVLRGLSRLICQKSLRREALWRSITLRAIYTSPEARSMVGFMASAVLDEIWQQVAELSAPSTREELAAALREVVRSAIELWRQTQVEVDRIYSAMPDVSSHHSMSDVLLWVRPHIVRERIGGASMANWGQGDASLGESRILLQGTALRQDSPLILKRYEEMAHRASSQSASSLAGVQHETGGY